MTGQGTKPEATDLTDELPLSAESGPDNTRPKPDLDESGCACTCGADQSSNLQFHQGLPAEAQAAISQIWQSSKTRLNAGSVREAHLS